DPLTAARKFCRTWSLNLHRGVEAASSCRVCGRKQESSWPNHALYSGDIKEFFPSCENDGLVAAQERLLVGRGYSVRAAAVFKNLAAVLTNAPEVEGFFRREELKQKLRLEVSALQGGEAVWLDLEISVLPTGRLAFRTHIKPTNLGQYIAADSYHAKDTLDNWPVAELCQEQLQVAGRGSPWLHECLAKRLYSVSLREMMGRAWTLWQRRAELLQPPAPRLAGHKRAALVLPFHRCWRHLGVQGLL
ncbi:unnamed protein product, partial [Effrenium voratum]